ncbi:Dehydrogenase/reductase SDR member 11 [Homalodisca vitripennis]|nr:Dehydrogenase/reductase SDR member 11 [Homalodisca vitripennis]
MRLLTGRSPNQEIDFDAGGGILELATELGDSEGKLIPRKCDLSVESDIAEAFEWIEETLKGADVIINNAGIMDNTPLLDAPTTIWRQMLDINILALVICSKLALNSMLSRGVDDGHVININRQVNTFNFDTSLVHKEMLIALRAMFIRLWKYLQTQCFSDLYGDPRVKIMSN